MRINVCGDHEATCYCCKYLSASYEPDWSDVTPGHFMFYCSKGVWDTYCNFGSALLHGLLERGKHCEHFEGAYKESLDME